jgi:outer membrane lipoprotein SlyB
MKRKTHLAQSGMFAVILIFALVLAGCQTSSRTKKGASMGAAGGGIAGAIVGGQSGQTLQGAAIGAAGGAIIGGVIGAVQEAKVQREQEALAQERAHQQELAKIRKAEATATASRERELAIKEGMRITQRELSEAETRAREAEVRLKALEDEVGQALSRKKTLEDAESRKADAEERIRLLEQELKELRGDLGSDDSSDI